MLISEDKYESQEQVATMFDVLDINHLPHAIKELEGNIRKQISQVRRWDERAIIIYTHQVVQVEPMKFYIVFDVYLLKGGNLDA